MSQQLELLTENPGQWTAVLYVTPEIQKKEIKPFVALSIKELEGTPDSRTSSLVNVDKFAAVRAVVRHVARSRTATKEPWQLDDVQMFLEGLRFTPECIAELSPLLCTDQIYSALPKHLRVRPGLAGLQWKIDVSLSQSNLSTATDSATPANQIYARSTHVILTLQLTDGQTTTYRLSIAKFHELRFCNEEDETPMHILCECEAIIHKRNRILGGYKLAPIDVRSLAPGKIIRFIKDLGLENLLVFESLFGGLGSEEDKRTSCRRGGGEMDALEMEPIGKYKADRNGSAKAAAWRNMVDADLDDVAFLADSDKAREARSLRSAPVAVCSQRRALCLAAVVFSTLFAIALLLVYAAPSPDCPCMPDNTLIPGATPTDSEAAAAAANKDRIASNGLVFPWRGARLPTFVIPKAYSLWLHPNLTTGEMRGEVSIDFKVDRDTTFVVINQRDMNVTERALFKSGGAAGPKIARALDYPPADQTYIEFKSAAPRGRRQRALDHPPPTRPTASLSDGQRDMTVSERAVQVGGAAGPETARAGPPPAHQTYIEFKRVDLRVCHHKHGNETHLALSKHHIYRSDEQRDMTVSERAVQVGGAAGPETARAGPPPAHQTYIEFKDKLRRKYNYTLSLRFITRLERSAEQRGLFLAGNHKHRCAMSRFWLTHARSAFPCLDEPHFRASFKLTVEVSFLLRFSFTTPMCISAKPCTNTKSSSCGDKNTRSAFPCLDEPHFRALFKLTVHARSAFPCLDEPHFRVSFKLTVVRDRFHVSLTNMPIVATEEAGFYLGHRLLQDEFAPSPPMSPHMMSIAVCRLQRRAAPSPPDATTEAADEKRDNEDRAKINHLPTSIKNPCSAPMSPHMMSIAVCRLQRRAAPSPPDATTEAADEKRVNEDRES
ncbi:unnamed protein product [Plutella xylostella]|uniref:(diamondback moth) hypothetical protein n=1 Tax=Plutella xylostella TaxID=51655 RepID=A0A8S4EW36_PLUXY|nr:unnamed protein product [Plutella xylostella]